MTVPAFLASSFRYLELTGISDVASVITSFRSETVTNGSPVWTEPSAGVFRSPVDAAGRFMELTITRVDATTLQLVLKDQTAFTICTRRAYLEVANGKVRIFTGQFHAIIEFEQNAATWELLYAFILDQSPDAQGSNSYYVAGNGIRSSGGTNDAQGETATQLFMKEDAAAAQANRNLRWHSAALGVPYESAFGSDVFAPEHIWTRPNGSAAKIGGRLYQIYQGRTDHVKGTELEIPLDDVTVGVFRVLGLLENTNIKLLCRKA